jgi:phage-related protein (TIGR01555 family)
VSAALQTPRREPGEKKGAFTRRLIALGFSDAEIVALCPKAKPEKHRVAPVARLVPATPRRLQVSPEALGRSRLPPPVSPLGVTTTLGASEAFRAAKPPPGVVPDGVRPMAMDADLALFATGLSRYTENLAWMGMPFLAELAQRAEYRQIVETLAKEMTRKWIKVSATGDEDKTKKVAAIEDALKKHQIRQKFRRLAELDGFFGRGHLSVNNGVNDDRDLLKVPMILDRRTFEPGTLLGFRVIEPIWTYPGTYDSINPLDDDFYAPRTWYVMGKEVHRTRLMTLVSREVPDLLKPQYQFGGISMSQLARPYIDNWLRTRQSVSDLVHSFSTMILSTDMSQVLGGDALGGGQDLFDRIELFNNLRDNRGTMALDKDREELSNVVTPLGTLDRLQSQAQEQLAAVSHEPLIILLGITPSGLNASSDGELQAWASYVKSMQEHLFDDPLDRVIKIIQINEWGEIDPDITFDYEPLRELSDSEEAAARKTEADTDALYVNAGVLAAEEIRQKLTEDEDSPYAGIDLSGPPPVPSTPPGGEEDPLGGPPDAPGGAPAATPSRASYDGVAPPPDRITDIATAIKARQQAHDAEFNESEHPRGQPENAGEFAKGTGANKQGKIRWEAEQGFRDAAAGKPKTPVAAWSDKQRQFYEKGHELHEHKHLTNYDPAKPGAPIRLTQTPKEYTPEQAQRAFNQTLVAKDPVFYHEGPGDWAAAAKTDGIENDYGVFATIGQPSNFADADVKTVVAFKVPKDVLARSVVPDMRYSGEGDPYQAVLKAHPDLTGADVGIGVEGNIPPAWIQDVKVIRKQAHDEDMKPVERRTYGTLQIGIETRKGEIRRGVEMPADYGYIMRTTGADGDRVDVFVGPFDPVDLPAFIVEQRYLDGRSDEHKVLIGFQTIDQATLVYDQSFSDGKGPDRRKIVYHTPFDNLRAWLRENPMRR